MTSPTLLGSLIYAVIAAAVYVRFFRPTTTELLDPLSRAADAAADTLRDATNELSTKLPIAIQQPVRPPSLTANKEIMRDSVSADAESLNRAYVPGYAQQRRAE